MRGLTVLAVLSVVVSVNVFMGLRQPGLTLAGNAMCGLEEHKHAETCYELKLICGDGQDVPAAVESMPATEESASESTEISVAETAVETAHVHSDVCYEKKLICDKKEHVHSLTCYADSTADVETQLDWQEMFKGAVTGDLRADLVALARSQIGYTESERNFEVDDKGVRSGYTRYGAWYGAPYSEWSAMFASFCLHYAGSTNEATPYNIGAASMLTLWNDLGRYVPAAGFTPEAGDLIFFENNTVGIVSSVYFDVLTVVRGDVEGAVVEQTIMTYESSILGYGILVPKKTEFSTMSDIPATDLPSTAFTLEACDCGNSTLDAISHADTCAYKSQLKSLASEKSATELYGIWDKLPSDAQSYILQYLTDNAWQFGTKADELKALIAGGSGSGSDEGLTATCGNLRFKLDGALPATATLQVVDPQYSQSTVLSFVNPNLHNCMNWVAVYDISITDQGVPYAPSTPVTVTVTIPDLVFDPSSEYFAVAHLNALTGEILESNYVEVVDNTVTFTANGFSPYLFYTIRKEAEGGERILGTNWMALRDSGYFTYWEQFLQMPTGMIDLFATSRAPTNGDDPSDVQVDKWGGETTNGDGVVVSKTIDGTDLENVFDITLTVQTQQSISEIYQEPDMAVVIVMDISNSMNDNFGGVTRYAAAMTAAENFLDQFAAHTGEVSKVGYVAFNTDAHEIFDLSACSNAAQANALKKTMRAKTGSIINASGYGESGTRFTNIEAGLRMGADMLAAAPNENKYLIFLSDGFPTTYVATGYRYLGYNPYTSSGTPGTDGVFYDYVAGCYCNYGTSYSDTAAIRARTMATTIKNAGVKIFSIGVDVGGQTIEGHERRNANGSLKKDFSVIERTSSIYEIGSATSTEAYKTWLRDSIGSGYYYDSTNADQLQAAYDKIFAEILRLKEEASVADWVAQDPLPLSTPEYLEFIGFYDKNSTLLATGQNLVGMNGEGAENTATYEYDTATSPNTITWDLKESGYTQTQSGGVTTYYYRLTYRVRLKNEIDNFVEGTTYETNSPTTLTYRVFESIDGVTTLSKQKNLAFTIPAVHGYLAEFSFVKKDQYGNTLAGAEFSLTHDDAACPICRGDGKTHVALPTYSATSQADGSVSFERIPSGHAYLLREVKAPPGYVGDSRAYRVVVSYDKLTWETDWTGQIINQKGSLFPETGGSGIYPYIIAGAVITAIPVIYTLYIQRRKRERRGDV